ncbi:MAG: NAD-dependent aldehyde dehydrogenase [Methanohalophilus sp.]|jgi:aldehyde dehydrogenase (NAD+)|nr:MAG: NAD-dependent aldehyde dehydrogenase [Methanohalophilus sp.]
MNQNIQQEIQRIFKIQQSGSSKINRTNEEERIELLMRIDKYLNNSHNRQNLYGALYRDLHKPEVEAIATEIGIVQSHISYVCKQLKNWMKPKYVPSPLPLVGTKSSIHYESRGVVLIISPWNYPFNLSIVPLIYAIAAGNSVIIKPSEISTNTSSYIKQMISNIFDESEVAVFEGDGKVAQELLDKPFNHIFFTGSPEVGKIVMCKAAQHLTSVTLELGGKSPAIVDETADVKKIARKAAWAKSINNGQTCISPDYLILQESIFDEFIEEYRKAIKEFYDSDGSGIAKSPDYCRIINKQHFQRLNNLFNDAIDKGALVLLGGEFDENDRYVSPTLLYNMSEEMNIMNEEVFGPLLPVLAYRDKSEAVEIIRKRPKPLTLYIASSSSLNIDYFIKETSAGGTVINDYMLGYSNPNLPFGGVNDSGLGKTLGFRGFREFSNERSVIHRRWGSLSLLYPPYSKKILWIIQKIYRFF